MKFFLKLVGGILAVTISLGLVFDYQFFSVYLPRIIFYNNFHPVSAGELYRAAQMSHDTLTATVKTYGIKSIIDLRAGEDDPDTNGITEPMTAKELGVDYFHVPMFASRVPSRETVENLLGIFDTAKRPILVHCSSGTHRTGVASALWLLAQKHESPIVASQQLSAHYGHVPLERRIKALVSGKPTIDTMLTHYVSDASVSSVSFEQWAEKNLQ